GEEAVEDLACAALGARQDVGERGAAAEAIELAPGAVEAVVVGGREELEGATGEAVLEGELVAEPVHAIEGAAGVAAIGIGGEVGVAEAEVGLVRDLAGEAELELEVLGGVGVGVGGVARDEEELGAREAGVGARV